MKSIIRWTLWERRWSIFWWAFGVAAFMVISLAFYPTFREQAAQLNHFLSGLSPAARSLFAGSGSFSTPEDFLNARAYYLMLPLLLALMAIMQGSSLIAKEENSGTIEHLLARPISRGRLLAAKAIAGVIALVIVGLAALFAALIIGQLVNIEVSVINIEVATLFTIILALLFGAIAFTITTVGYGARVAGAGIAAFIAIGSYIIVSLASVVEWLQIPAKVLPHNYYRSSDILYGDFGWQNAIGLLAASLVLGVICWWAFRRRDIGA